MQEDDEMSHVETKSQADGMPEGQDLLEVEAKMTQELVEQADPWIDLQRAGSESEHLMRALADRFEAQVIPLLAGAAENPQMLSKMLRVFVRQLARAQADIFVLKSAVLGRDRLVLTRDWEFRDPLQRAQAAIVDAFGVMPLQGAEQFTLPLDPSVVGYGWHDTEEQDGKYWRWSGPGLTAGLMLPRFFDVPMKVEVSFNVLRRDIVPLGGGISVNGRPVEAVVDTKGDGLSGTISFPLDITKETSPFFMMVFEVQRTASPAVEKGGKDTRELGICVRRIVFKTISEPAA